MYLNLGGDVVIKFEDVLGIFDLDTATVSKKTRDWLNKVEKEGAVKYIDFFELPKSFVVTPEVVYITPLSTATLRDRAFM